MKNTPVIGRIYGGTAASSTSHITKNSSLRGLVYHNLREMQVKT